MPLATDQAETLQLVPPEEYINTPEMKLMLAKEDQAVEPQVGDTVPVEVKPIETAEATKCAEVGFADKYE